MLPFLILLAPQLVAAGFGNAFSSGPTAPGNWIRVANSTLVVPKVPLPQVGLLSLWVGMGTSNGVLIQSLTESYNGAIDEGCGQLNGTSWCSWSSALGDAGQVGGQQAITKPGDHVQMSYMYNETSKFYDILTLINGELISTYSMDAGHGLGWGTAEECNDGFPAYPCGVVPKHDWIDTVLVLDQAQPDYNKTFGNGGSTGTLITTDGGKTWTGDKITINQVNFTPTCPFANGTTMGTLDQSVFNVTCGVDYPGNDIKTSYQASYQACVSSCDATPGCAAVIFRGGTCYLKSAVGKITPSADKDLRGGILATSGDTAPSGGKGNKTVDLSCPSWDTITYTSGGHDYTISCAQDFPGHDIKMTYTKTYAECIATCDELSECRAVSYTGNSCYLKAAVGSSHANSKVRSAYRS